MSTRPPASGRCGRHFNARTLCSPQTATKGYDRRRIPGRWDVDGRWKPPTVILDGVALVIAPLAVVVGETTPQGAVGQDTV